MNFLPLAIRFKRRMKRWWFTSPKLTTRGKIIIVLAECLILIGIVEHSEALLQVGFLFFFLCAACYVFCAVNFSQLNFKRRIPSCVFANSAFNFTMTVGNEKGCFDSFLVGVQDYVFQRKFSDASFVDHVAAGSNVELSRLGILRRRGIYESFTYTLQSSFPLGIASKQKTGVSHNHITVFPQAYLLPALKTHLQNMLADPLLDNAAELSSEGDFYGLREYQQGDSVKQMAWAATIRHQRPLVKVYECAANNKLEVVFHQYSPPNISLEDAAERPDRETKPKFSSKSFENALSQLTGLLVYLDEQGCHYQLTGAWLDWQWKSMGAQQQALYQQLSIFSSMEIKPIDTLDEIEKCFLSQPEQMVKRIVFSPCPLHFWQDAILDLDANALCVDPNKISQGVKSIGVQEFPPIPGHKPS